MRKSPFFMLALLLLLLVTPFAAWSQSIQTDGTVEAVSFTGDGSGLSGVATDAELVSHQGEASAHHVPTVDTTCNGVACDGTSITGVNADQVDGLDASAFALDTDLQNVEALLLALGTAQVPRTGQTTCYDAGGVVVTCGTGIGLGQDGDLQLGVTWPNPRFTKNGDGTVTDNLTGLIWLENADCAAGGMTWTAALAFANTLSDGSVAHNGGDCGLSDLSAAGAWRLPNVRELQSLVHYGVFSPAVPNTAGTGQWTADDPFSGVQSASYWSSTTWATSTDFAWDVGMSSGNPINGFKTSSFRVWPVRGGQ